MVKMNDGRVGILINPHQRGILTVMVNSSYVDLVA
jgi:hypothetical protein